jgi:signal peptidase
MHVLTRATRALRRVLDLALVALVAVALAGVFFGRILPLLGPTTLVVRGPSMMPSIPVGALVVANPVDPAALAVGDVVSLRVGPEQAIFTHRVSRVVLRQGEVWIETRGDANAEPDPAIIPASSVIGRVSATVPLLGYLVALLSTLSGALLLVAVAGALLMATWILESFELDVVDEEGLRPLPARGPVLGVAAGRTART